MVLPPNDQARNYKIYELPIINESFQKLGALHFSDC